VKLILLITGNFDTAKQIRRILHSDYSILTATSEESAIEFARSVLVDAILIDSSPPYQKVGELVLRTRQLQPEAAVIALVPQEIAEREKEEYLDGVYDYIRKPLSSTEVRHAVSRALERRTLLQEVKLMRTQLDKISTPLSAGQVLTPTSQIYEKTLRELSKALAASFDIKRLLNLFLDAVTEMFRVGKISVLLLDEASNEYRIEISRGLHPEFCTTLKFPHKEGIAQWLQVHGRILKMEDVRDGPAAPSSLETKRVQGRMHFGKSHRRRLPPYAGPHIDPPCDSPQKEPESFDCCFLETFFFRRCKARSMERGLIITPNRLRTASAMFSVAASPLERHCSTKSRISSVHL